MPKRNKAESDDEEISKKRKLPHDDEPASDIDERNAPPKKKAKAKHDDETIHKNEELEATPTKDRSKQTLHSTAKVNEDLPATRSVEVTVIATKEKSIGRLRAENLKIPAHQTPGKHTGGLAPIIENENLISRPPRMRLNLSRDDKETPTEEPPEAGINLEETNKEREIQKEQNENDPVAERQDETRQVDVVEPIWMHRGGWLWGLLLVHLLMFLWCGPLSTWTFSQYKNVLGVKPELGVAIDQEISQAEDEALKRMNTQIQLLDFNMARLAKGRDSLFADLPTHQQVFARLSEVMDQVNVHWTDEVQATIKAVEKLVEEDHALSASTIASIRALLGDDASKYLLDLTHMTLWNISTNLTECGQTDLLTEGRVLDAQRQLILDLQEETSKLVNDERVKNSIIQWVLENTDAVVEQPSVSNLPRGSNIDAIHRVVRARMDVATADLTGKVDFAAISSGGVIIKSGKYATTPSIVDTLPYGNRLLHTLKLRFYGHGPEAAIRPSYPSEPSKALGSCWSFVATPSGLGKYAVLSVSLANSIYATQVAIEHPPRDVNDRAKAAIRSFRVVGFESADATGKAWDMGRFEYQLGDDYLQVFDLEEEVGKEDIPAVQSVSLLIDSNWGLGYSCLYRFRVHGHEVEVDSSP